MGVKKRQFKINQTNHRPVFKKTIKVEEDKQKRLSRVETLHSLSYSVIEIAQGSQVNMSLSIIKILKSIIFNFINQNIKFLWKGFFYRLFYFAQGPLFLRTIVSKMTYYWEIPIIIEKLIGILNNILGIKKQQNIFKI